MRRVKPEALAELHGLRRIRTLRRGSASSRTSAAARHERPARSSCSVRAGLLGSWLVHVPVDQVEAVSHDERRIDLRSGGLLAGPRKRS